MVVLSLAFSVADDLLSNLFAGLPRGLFGGNVIDGSDVDDDDDEDANDLII
ncbi:hypothetical protein SAMD00019534_022700 [Acytostelium subglobosum LB1]|uniref:hypothetical protein n=1 Tax=Acytostelium subglobosum LB1 TaxID=1410327 RepID=UPI0006447C21|nr:hypothetical protein SAMD00019534_022700 [Acytostelium subglobosum LB1]GAM19095.1 hypothetical protein SAMD00019534_022700 [Acytostelium subglobosum LB1]|eukprot:XP_012757022.1 hypothetical protein SAMD00019534_022700 [Acytostelium subglobosum LB1]